MWAGVSGFLASASATPWLLSWFTSMASIAAGMLTVLAATLS